MVGVNRLANQVGDIAADFFQIADALHLESVVAGDFDFDLGCARIVEAEMSIK